MIESKYFRLLDRKLPVMGLGTWRLGSRGDRSIDVLRRGLDLGLTMIDTAESYAFGYEEQLVGEAIKGYNRDDLFIITKVAPNRRRSEILEAAQRSVRNLGTHIDLYLLHAPHIVEGTMKERMLGLEDTVGKGYARSIGVSNFKVSQIEEARSYLSKNDIVAVENKLNLFDKYWLNDVVSYCQQEGMAFIAYTPLDTGRTMIDNGKLSSFARKYEKTNIQVALNWLHSIDSVISIPKFGKEKHLLESIGSLNWRLSKEDWNTLTEEYKLVDGYNMTNWMMIRENIRYYFTPRLFKLYASYYKNPKHFIEYIQGTKWKKRNHL